MVKSKVAKEAEKALAPPEEDDKKISFVGTGSTILNLACSGRWNGGFPVGCYHLLVGDPAAGKTWIAHSILAEAAIADMPFHRLIYDDSENGSLMDVKKFWPKLAERIEPPARDSEGKPIYSSTVENFYDYFDDAVKQGGSFIWIEDSQDALSSETDQKKTQQEKAARRKASKKKEEGGDGKDEELKGSYGTAKAKKHSSGLRDAHLGIRGTESMMVMLSQTRDNIGFGAKYNPKTRSGGRAMAFYAGHELWFSIVKRLKRNYKGKKRGIGTMTKILVKKNRVTGSTDCEVVLPIYRHVGIDDLGSCIHFLVDEQHWSGKIDIKGDNPFLIKGITAPEFNFEGTSEKLIEQIEEKGQGRKLRKLVQQAWDEIEAAIAIKRRNRYS